MSDDPYIPDHRPGPSAPPAIKSIAGRCEDCSHWALDGRMGDHGYGLCNARPHQMRAGHHTAGFNVCRLGRFLPLVP